MTDPRIGKYRLDRTIGVGSFATVWLAHDDLLDSPVAIKVLADNWARDPDIRRRFVEEAKILRKLDDDRVVRIHVIDELDDGRPYFVMTWADRGTLADRIDERTARGASFGVAEAVDIIDELCAGLTVVHGLGVVHRDLKPSNVLFRSRPQATSGPYPGEQILLSDFGLAKDLEVASGYTLAAGTPAYMAPEQARATTTLDRRADVYSAGVMLFELLTGQLPFEPSALGDVARRPDVAVAGLLAGLRPDAPTGLGASIEQALAVRPDDRFASATSFAESVRAALVRDPTEIGESGPPRPAVPTRPSSPGVRGRVANVLGVLDEVTGRPGLAAARARLESRCRAVAVVSEPIAGSLRATIEGLGLDCEVVDPTAAAGRGQLGPAATADAVVAELDPDPTVAASTLRQVRDVLHEAEAGPVLFAGLADAEAVPRLIGEAAVGACAVPLAPADDPAAVVAALTHVSRRDDLVRASAALATVDAMLRAGASPEVATAWSRVGDALDTLRLEVPALDELCVLRDVVAGRVMFPPEREPELRRLLLAPDAGTRLELAATASIADQQRATTELLDRWRTDLNGGRVPFASRSAAEVVVRSLDRLWASLA